ncbi:hypothetical protein OWV82_006737 [Melia azedarach]|uniref:Uncharacterized protein n=1 Tax=Melia azedarach TaxID=155640 RepID=A0ACC1YJ01_MELAZ|nr:hypothetical protein OWV82_006737 [Melia azedarach]
MPSVQEELLKNITNASIPILAEQQQQPPQTLQPISKANVSSNFSGGENQNNQHCSLEVNKMSENEPLNFADLNMQMEMTDVEKQLQIAFYDPCYYYLEDDQLEQFVDSSEQLFPSIWSWHEDIHRND